MEDEVDAVGVSLRLRLRLRLCAFLLVVLDGEESRRLGQPSRDVHFWPLAVTGEGEDGEI